MGWRTWSCFYIANVKVPVIVLNWNGWKDTFACLQSLRDSGETPEVWLVDNSSVEDKNAECRLILPELRVVKLGENFGWAGGYNRALKLAAAEGVEMAYLLNNDTTVRPGFLAAAEEAMSRDAGLAAVGSVIVFGGGGQLVKFDGEYHSPEQRRSLPQDANRVRPVKDVNGAGMLVRLAAVQRDGGFDERFFCYAEETEWCWRMSRKGWKITVAPASVVVHKCEGSNQNLNSYYYRTRNQFLLRACCDGPLGWGRKWGVARNILLELHPGWHCLNQRLNFALVEGLRDGWRGRFGKRPEWSGWWHRRSIGCWRYAARFYLWHLRCRSRLKLGTKVRTCTQLRSAK